jgi:peptidoglycan hydrolase-like protein with peptidoglycan-binding domain
MQGSPGIAVHYTGSIWPLPILHGNCADYVRGIQEEHLAGEYSDIAYNYLVCRHGYIYIGRGYQYQSGANGTDFGNTTYYAICGLTGVLDGPVLIPGFTPALVPAVQRVATHLQSLGAAANDIIGHGDIPGNDTWCPGNLNLYVADGSFRPGSTFAAPVATPDAHVKSTTLAEPPEWPGVEFTNPPPTEHASVRVWQEQMVVRGWRLAVDGVYGNRSQLACRLFQAEKALGVDGIVGEQTWNATWTEPITESAERTWPGFYFVNSPAALHPDISRSVPTVTTHTSVSVWQNQMAHRGWNIGQIDGVYGSQAEAVCRAFQEEKELEVDGVVGPATWAASWDAPIT